MKKFGLKKFDSQILEKTEFIHSFDEAHRRKMPSSIISNIYQYLSHILRYHQKDRYKSRQKVHHIFFRQWSNKILASSK